MDTDMKETGEEVNVKTPEGNPKIDRSSSVQEKLAQAKGKSKRVRSVSISEPEPTKAQPKYSKNSRKSRNGFGRGLPKKGGAGGKGVWGKPGSELESPAAGALDARDPNYDSDSMGADVQLEAVTVELTDEDIKKLTESLVLEYYDHADTSEVDRALTENWNSISLRNRYLVVVTMIEIAMEHKPSHRELTSILLSDLYLECVTQTDIVKGYDALLGALPEIVLDSPEAPTILGNFLARSVADDCLPPKYLTSHKGKLECQYAIQALDRADMLVNMKHGMVKLDNVWGVGGARRPVRSLIKQMTLLLKEFLTSEDPEEAIRCLTELEVPHFHHELVYEALSMAIERSDDKSIAQLVRLLKAMADAGVLSITQMDGGFARIYENIADLQLDVPNAHSLMERLVTVTFDQNIISKDTKRKMPARGRKRFVSEGDGGRIKERGDVFPLSY